jgi:hypothetical protein
MMLKFGFDLGKRVLRCVLKCASGEHHSQDLISYRNDFLRTKDTFDVNSERSAVSQPAETLANI